MGRRADWIKSEIDAALAEIAAGNIDRAESILLAAANEGRAINPKEYALADWLKIEAAKRPPFEEYVANRAADKAIADQAWASAIRARQTARQS
jgi:hypothetical protein